MDELQTILSEYWMFILPLIIIQVILQITALIHLFKHSHYTPASKLVWTLVILLFQMIGPIVYFAFGGGKQS
ncbi:Negative regulatory protein yxlE [Alloiococcus otitis]|uniref:Cardiolipin synthase N-terminal domain-containing protein n=1 Tax=Alloiococcus otitis ATCC 51267 TaxID=883081 RepID=K9EAT4_9LACT|nr:PLD nuclease N-terminal domain-containing protein [Alloiococcus otitis]EKU94339.1 hypothetical protein HMPREF9698_00067 [Alloiococcus otitis ATCC 51267]SUU81331.1 Negative regulatory protein yxlE [Alloiococcus otitis]